MSRHRAPRSTGRRGLLTVAVAALVVLGLTLPASAFFSVGSTAATGASRAGTLGTPGATASGVTATNVTIAITAPPTGPTPTAYRVARTAPTAAASVCTVTGSSGSCSDTAPVDGQTNTYAVYARLSGTTWESVTPRALSVVVPAADTTAPVTTASASPAPNAAGWNSTNVIVTLTATDASGVATTYYSTDGSTPSITSTVYSAPFVVSTSSVVRFFSVDNRGNTEQVKSVTVSIDKTVPTGSVTAPTDGATVGDIVTVSGSAADLGGSGVASVQPQYRAGTTGAWTNLGASITSNPSSWSTSWNTTGLSGSYSLRVVVMDVAGNTSESTAPTTTVTAQAPPMSVSPSTTTPTAGTPFTLTLTTGTTLTGVQPITVTGASGGAISGNANFPSPTIPTSATFANGVAQVQMTLTKAGVQPLTVKLNVDNRQASTSVTVKAQGPRIFFSDCSPSSYSCTTGSSQASMAGNGSNLIFKISRQSVDDYGNALSVSDPLTVNLTVVGAGQAALSSGSLTIAAGQTVSTSTSTMSRNGAGARTGVITAKATGYADATLTLQ